MAILILRIARLRKMPGIFRFFPIKLARIKIPGEVHDLYKVHLQNIIKNLSSANLYFEDRAPAQLRALLQDIKTAIDLEKGLLTLHQKFLFYEVTNL